MRILLPSSLHAFIFHFKNETHVNRLPTKWREHMYWIWSFKAKYTRYRICRQAAFKNVRTMIFLESGGTDNNCRPWSHKVIFFDRTILGAGLWGPTLKLLPPWWGHGSAGWGLPKWTGLSKQMQLLQCLVEYRKMILLLLDTDRLSGQLEVEN
jgi:hypothetical protein